MSNASRLKQVFVNALGIELAQVTDDLGYNRIKAWDSTAHMMLVADIEAEFDVMLETDDIIDMSSSQKRSKY